MKALSSLILSSSGFVRVSSTSSFSSSGFARMTAGRDAFEELFLATSALGDALSTGSGEALGEVMAGVSEGSGLANATGLGLGAVGVGVSAIVTVGVAVGLTWG